MERQGLLAAAACLVAGTLASTQTPPICQIWSDLKEADCLRSVPLQAPMHEGRGPARLLAVACLVAGALAQTQTPPDPSIFAPVQIAGDLGTGFPAYYVGCTGNGATLQDIVVFANDNFLRGIEVHVLLACPSLLSRV